MINDRVWFLIFVLLLLSRRLGTLRKIDDQFHTDDLSVRTSFSQSAKKESTRNILIAVDLEKSERHHFGSSSTARSNRRSYLNGKLNYYCNSHACIQLQRHAISGGIQLNPGPVLGHNYRQLASWNCLAGLSMPGVSLIRDKNWSVGWPTNHAT